MWEYRRYNNLKLISGIYSSDGFEFGFIKSIETEKVLDIFLDVFFKKDTLTDSDYVEEIEIEFVGRNERMTFVPVGVMAPRRLSLSMNLPDVARFNEICIAGASALKINSVKSSLGGSLFPLTVNMAEFKFVLLKEFDF